MSWPSGIAGLVLVAAACGASPDPGPTTAPSGSVAGFDVMAPVGRWELPAELQEVSGLAVSRPGFIIAHNDERGHLVEIDYRTGRVGRRWTFGVPVVRADFEGIDIRDAEVTLMSSDGRLWSGTLPAEGGPISPVAVVDTRLGRRCEFEGLARNADAQWILPCKTPRGRRDAAVMFSLFLVSASGDATKLAVPPVRGSRRVSPSSVAPANDALNGGLIVVFGPEHAIGHLAADATMTTLVAWPASRHPQPEGAAVDGDRLIIADEGQGRRAATLTVYGRAR